MNNETNNASVVVTNNSNHNHLSSVLRGSCDHCRFRKIKCDGKNPCSNCVSRRLRKKHNRARSSDGDQEVSKSFECVYSPEKRRGPRRSTNSMSHDNSMHIARSGFSLDHNQNRSLHPSTFMTMNRTSGGTLSSGTSNITQWQQQQPVDFTGGTQHRFPMIRLNGTTLSMNSSSSDNVTGGAVKKQKQEMHESQQRTIAHHESCLQLRTLDTSQHRHFQLTTREATSVPSNNPVKADEATAQTCSENVISITPCWNNQALLPRSVHDLAKTLDDCHPKGLLLRAYFILSIDEIFHLPTTPSMQELGSTIDAINDGLYVITASTRFVELALGAIVRNDIAFAMELCNASVHCLLEARNIQLDDDFMAFEFAKLHFLIGVFQIYRSDMERYFKYRRICLKYLSKIENDNRAVCLLAAISYTDSWIYMMHNGSDKDIPNLDCGPSTTTQPNTMQHVLPQVATFHAEFGSGTSFSTCSIASDEKNKNWMQGKPPVFSCSEAPCGARALDAISHVIRVSCRRVSGLFESLDTCRDNDVATSTARAHITPEELARCRQMISSAYSLMILEEPNKSGMDKCNGLRLVLSAVDTFLQCDSFDAEAEFTDAQIQSILAVCHTALDHPLLLYHAGPTYHIVSNTALLLCHVLNGWYTKMSNPRDTCSKSNQFDEVLDTFLAARKILSDCRRQLPERLRCHEIPRPSLGSDTKDQPFISFSKMEMCPCLHCQRFVILGRNPTLPTRSFASKNLRSDEEATHDVNPIGFVRRARGQSCDGSISDFSLDDNAMQALISSLNS